MSNLTHFDGEGSYKMVDVTQKDVTLREAIARGIVEMQPETLKSILDKGIAKGDVFEVARISGIMGAKKTSVLIPLCHPIQITSIEITFTPIIKKSQVKIEALVKAISRTGVEMEALTAVSVAALTVYDMCKAIDRGIIINNIELIKKSGGKSGLYFKEGKK